MGINLNKDIKTLFLEKIQELINNVEIKDGLTITVYEFEGQTLITYIEYENKVIEIDVYNENNITIKITDESSEQVMNSNLSITKQENTINFKYEDNLNTSLEMARTLNNNSNEINSLTNIKINKENVINGLELNINRNLKIGEISSITTSYNQVDKILLNDYGNEALETEISIDYALSTLNKRIITSLRKKREQTNSTLLNYIIEYYNKKEEEKDLEEENKRNLFNGKFKMYEGEGLDQGIVLNMLDEAGNNMTDYRTEGTDTVILNIKEGVKNQDLITEIKNGLNMEEDKVDSYGIKLEYDENGLLNRIILTLEKEEQSP